MVQICFSEKSGFESVGKGDWNVVMSSAKFPDSSRPTVCGCVALLSHSLHVDLGVRGLRFLAGGLFLDEQWSVDMCRGRGRLCPGVVVAAGAWSCPGTCRLDQIDATVLARCRRCARRRSSQLTDDLWHLDSRLWAVLRRARRNQRRLRRYRRRRRFVSTTHIRVAILSVNIMT